MTLQNNLGLPFFWVTNSFDIGVELFEINALKSFLSLSLFILMVNTVWFSSMGDVVTCPKSLKAPIASCVQWRKTYRKSSIWPELTMHQITNSNYTMQHNQIGTIVNRASTVLYSASFINDILIADYTDGRNWEYLPSLLGESPPQPLQPLVHSFWMYIETCPKVPISHY